MERIRGEALFIGGKNLLIAVSATVVWSGLANSLMLL